MSLLFDRICDFLGLGESHQLNRARRNASYRARASIRRSR